MKVRAIAITQSLVPDLQMTAEELLVYEARVSSPSNQENLDTAPKLLRFLIKKKHWSPFDMINLTVEVTTSKAVAIQILRHWSIKPQEFSQRYAEVTDIEPVELRRQAASNRQSSEEVFDPEVSYVEDWTSTRYTGRASDLLFSYMRTAKNFYRALLEVNTAKECARMVLPMATSTTMYLNGSVRSWIHYLEQRCDLHAQKEHQIVANEIKNIFTKHFPNTAEAIYGTFPSE